MSGLLASVRINYQQVLNETVYDDTVDNWPLMQGPGPVVAIVITYLWLVLYQGPKWMENRKPFELKYTLILYNLSQVVFSAWQCSKILTVPGVFTYVWNHSCFPLPRDINPLSYHFHEACWWYLFAKVVELLDTVFFVMRKKQNQVTVLHVYHHSNMVISTWGFLRYIKGEQALWAGLMNCFVHVVMYSYYLLAAMGPRIQKYLWWKKYITKLQLFQFFSVLVHLSLLLVFNCNMPKLLTVYMYIQTIIFIILFSNFYFQAYLNKDRLAAKQTQLQDKLRMEHDRVQDKQILKGEENERLAKDKLKAS